MSAELEGYRITMGGVRELLVGKDMMSFSRQKLEQFLGLMWQKFAFRCSDPIILLFVGKQLSCYEELPNEL
jgi:hypothetical protein